MPSIHVTHPWRPSLWCLWLASSVLSVSCAGSTGPNPHSATSVAQYIDALYKEAVVIANNDPLYDTRLLFLTEAEYAPAFGAPATAITVATATGDQRWQVVAYEMVNGTDSTYTFVAYSDDQLANVVVATFDPADPGNPLSVQLMANDTIFVFASVSTVAVSTVSIAGACVPVSGLTNPGLSAVASAPCQAGTFAGTVHAIFPVVTSLPPALASLTFSASVVQGARFVQ
jgi:hypothetical protein